MNYPPSPKAMEDRGIMNYGRCRACGTTKSEPKKARGWMLRRFAPLHDVKIDFATAAEITHLVRRVGKF